MAETLAERDLEDGRSLRIVKADAGDAGVLREVIVSAFRDRPALVPPPSALNETDESIAAKLAQGFGVVALVDGAPRGVVIVSLEGETAGIHRVSVATGLRQLGVASAMIDVVLQMLPDYGVRRVELVARAEFPLLVDWWKRRGFDAHGHSAPYVKLGRLAPIRIEIPAADAMRNFGGKLAKLLRGGDLLIASGELGAGKTTLAQGIGAGLNVEHPVISPTFVIARIHPAIDDGPGLLHVDAYRLSGWAELEDLDLQTEGMVTLVEWGKGVAEGLAEQRLEIELRRATGPLDSELENGDGDGDEPRQLLLTPIGPRWNDLRTELGL